MSNPGDQHPEETEIRIAGRTKIGFFPGDITAAALAELSSAARAVLIDKLSAIDSKLKHDQSKGSEAIVEVRRHGRSVGLAVIPDLRALLNLSNVARPIDPAHELIPEIGLKILPFIVPKKLRDAVTGDLTEDFRTFAARWGRSYALRWLWWELAGLCVRRFGPTAIVIGIGTWFRQKLGW